MAAMNAKNNKQVGGFQEVFDTYDWDGELQSILTKTTLDVERALRADKRNLDDFKALISPAAKPYICLLYTSDAADES